MNRPTRWIQPLSALLLLLTLVGGAGFAPRQVDAARTVTPIDGNASCSQLLPGVPDVRELKVEPVADGTYSDGTLTVTIDVSANQRSFDWVSNIGVLAVFAKAGPGGNLYQYDPPAFGDTGLSGSQRNGLSHISFCYVPLVVANPTVVTQASAAIVLGGSIFDTATLSGGNSPTGTITFNLYGPDDAACSTSIFSSPVAVAGNGDYTSASFTPTAVGTYRWIANYSGDANNNATANGCNEANESVVVSPTNPTIVTQASDPVTIGGSISDTATLAGGVNPTGSITFDLYGPDDADCSGTPIFSSTVPVAGDGDYTSASFTPTAVGTYRWIANYGGDGNNNATANGCNEANESVVVSPTNPTLVTVASPPVEIGQGALSDTATLSGGVNPTGTIAFALYGPDDADCTGEPIFTDTVDVNQGNGDYTSGGHTPTAPGTYRWIANYSGDANNNATANGCNEANENVVILQAEAQFATAQSVIPNDSATLTGGFNPTGTITFELYSTEDCTGTAVYSESVTVTGNGTYETANSGDFVITEANDGTYYWKVLYSGDTNNAPLDKACGTERVTVEIDDNFVEP